MVERNLALKSSARRKGREEGEREALECTGGRNACVITFITRGFARRRARARPEKQFPMPRPN